MDLGLMTTSMAGCEDLELSWKEFFRDSSKWWDQPGSKQCPGQSGFRHAATKGPLWMDSCGVSEELRWRRFAVEHRGDETEDALSPSLIWACCKNKDLYRGTRIHNELQKRGLGEKLYSNALVTMYAQCGELQKAQALLDTHKSSSVIPWTALIASYGRQGKGKDALECYKQMQLAGVPPNEVTYACVLKACAVTRDIDKGMEIHERISMQGLLEHNTILGGALVDMYAKCGALCQAQSILEELPSRNIVSWSALIIGYARMGQGQQALDCFELMQREGIIPDAVTYACILKACASIGAINMGKQIHGEVLRQGFLEHDIVLGNALVDMYAKCGVLSQARNVLEKLPSRNVASWNALIAGYAQTGQGQSALESFQQMQHEGILPDAVTYLCVVKACAVIGAIEKGKEIHDEISRQGLLKHNVLLGNALVDMYAKCGDLLHARTVLEKLPSRNVVSWNALITGYAQNGQSQQALQCFGRMQKEGILPDVVTFMCLLNLCCHLGLVEKGQELFDSMEAVYGLQPDVDCFTCMADLLGRAGHLGRAVELIQGMPFSANSSIWHCLLGACQRWVDVNVGTWAFQQAIELDKCDGAAYVLAVNIFAAAGMLEKVKEIEAMRIKNKAWTLETARV